MISNTIEEIREAAKRMIDAPWVNVTPGVLGHDTIFIRVSLQPKEEWAYHIMENSTNAGFAIYKSTGTLDNWCRFRHGFQKLRKSSSNTMESALQKINVHVQQAKAVLPVE
jgi:hypothetical protein